jgi:hypothetical protein
MCAEIHCSISSPPDVEDISVKFTRVPWPYAWELKCRVPEDANIVEGQLFQSGPHSQSVDPQTSAVISHLSAVVSQPSAVGTKPSAFDTLPSKSNLCKRKVDKTTGLTITFSWIFFFEGLL